MDNMYVIGYRIDVEGLSQDDGFNLEDQLKGLGIDIDSLPGSEWMWWPSSERDKSILSFFLMDDKHEFKVDYRCPIDRSELWEDMHEHPFDAPQTYEADCQTIRTEPLFRALREKYPDKAKVQWGLALMLG